MLRREIGAVLTGTGLVILIYLIEAERNAKKEEIWSSERIMNRFIEVL